MFGSRQIVLALVFLVMAWSGNAQSSLMKGYLLDSVTHFSVKGGTVTNHNTQKKVKTDVNGFFFLEAAPGDLIYLQAPNYKNDTVRFTVFTADTARFFLSPTGSILANVTVRSSYTKYQLDSMERRAEFEEARGLYLKTVGPPPNEGFGVNLSLDKVFKKKYKDQRRQEALFRRTEEQLYVESRFSPELVASYTGLRGEALRQFIYLYTPSYRWLRQHPTQQDLLFYISDKLKEYRASLRSNNRPKI